MRPRLPRLTFLWRFTLATFVLTLLSAFVLATTLERNHRQALETDAELAALGRLSAQLTVPLDALASAGKMTAPVETALKAAADDANRFQYVTDLRIYRANGQAAFPPGAPAALADVHATLANDNVLHLDHGTTITAYAPYYTRDNQVFAIALDFSPAQFNLTESRERTALFTVVGLMSAISFIGLLSLAAGASREIEYRRRESQSTFVQTLTIMADVIDLRDPYTAGHSKRVAVYSRQLAIEIGLPSREVEVIESGALLHDIGKISVPDAVLFKPTHLTAEERSIISTHPVVGARLLGGIASMEDVVPCVLHHHEKLDGTGYPDRLCGDSIPLGARVVAVADTFDAMTTDRPYRRALSIDTAVAELVRVAGTQLDERLVLAFSNLVIRGEIVPPPCQADLERAAQTEMLPSN